MAFRPYRPSTPKQTAIRNAGFQRTADAWALVASSLETELGKPGHTAEDIEVLSEQARNARRVEREMLESIEN